MPTTTRTKSVAELMGVRETPRNAKDRLIEKAINLFYDHGFHTVGLDRVIEETGVTKTTFYKHFESKDDLIVAAIRKRDEWETRAWARAIRKLGGNDPIKQLLALYDVLDVWFNDPQYGGCIFLNAAIEFPSPNEPAHQAAVLHKKQTLANTLALAKQAKLRDPEHFADVYITLLEGTLVLRHVHSRNDAALMTRAVVKELIDRHLPPQKNAG